jgi:hypothetical protein
LEIEESSLDALFEFDEVGTNSEGLG